MTLKRLIEELRKLMNQMIGDLEKTERGNKTAAQRVRTHSIQFGKAAKLFRKESLVAERKGLLKKVPKARKGSSKKDTKRGDKNKAKKRIVRKQVSKRPLAKRKKTYRRR